jgi:hypothetical protein
MEGFSVKKDAASGGPQETGDHIEAGRFPRAIRADKAANLLGPHVKGNVVDSHEAVEPLCEIVDLQNVSHGIYRVFS